MRRERISRGKLPSEILQVQNEEGKPFPRGKLARKSCRCKMRRKSHFLVESSLPKCCRCKMRRKIIFREKVTETGKFVFFKKKITEEENSLFLRKKRAKLSLLILHLQDFRGQFSTGNAVPSSFCTCNPLLLSPPFLYALEPYRLILPQPCST